MQFDLSAGTDSAMCAIFDPTSLAQLLNVSWYDVQDSVGLDDGILEREKAAGNLLLYSIASDGTFLFRFYIGEQAPSNLLDAAVTSVENGLLRIPSGKLCAAGYEYLPQKEQKLSTIDSYDIVKLTKPVFGTRSLGTMRTIEPGNYAVNGHGLPVQPSGAKKDVTAIFVMTKLSAGADLSKMTGVDLSYSWR